MIETIAFDADDTLWQNEAIFQHAQARFRELLSRWETGEEIQRVLTKTEMHNISLYGYGIKAFTLSMIETALQVSGGEIDSGVIQEIIAIGRSMLQTEVSLLPNIEKTLRRLSQNYRLMIITMGDLLDQTSKLAHSGLEGYFSLVEVVNHKTIDVYQGIMEKYGLEIKQFIMVGNSLRSDIAPVLAMGGKAVHIPAETTWELEHMPGFDPNQDGFFEINDMSELPQLIEDIESTGI